MAHPSSIASSLSRHIRAIETLSLPALQEATDKTAIEQADAQLGFDLDAASDLYRRLRLCLDDAETEQERDDIESVLDEHGRQLNRLRISARSARSTAHTRAKNAAAQAARQELSLLTSSSSTAAYGSGLNNTNSAEGDKVQTASADVTQALQRSVQLLSNEVERSTFSAQLLEESSATIQLLNSEYTSFSNILKNSVTLIKSMEREDWYNALMVFASMAFFLGCVLYILKKRIYDNTAGIVLSGAGSVMGKGWRGAAKAMKEAKASKNAAAAVVSASSSSLAAVASSKAASASSVAASSLSAAAAAVTSAAASNTAAAAAAENTPETTPLLIPEDVQSILVEEEHSPEQVKAVPPVDQVVAPPVDQQPEHHQQIHEEL
ncbi:Protein transport protein sec20 [Tilletia horrida]|uniref:Protein transport protein sec20 n=1 Tax=Tilletia horrida TaxID=155126 RepID=A0AAN6GRS5_9BASI|nr:Protein transport protein sec20 [Tilletia horrida]KAK0550711.1 Protein transport protein sec20 [Tilletia horrida]KAK0565964.1 Protein transport protein sec20 [Tilletia horrida]